MPLAITPVSAIALLSLTAAGYAIATIGMKMASSAVTMAAVAIIMVGFTVATLMEIVLLRSANMSLVYLGVVVAETALVLGYAYSIGHGLNLQQMAGAGMVLGGVLMLGSHA